jgi:predicted MFS family arabinose efflux permease
LAVKWRTKILSRPLPALATLFILGALSFATVPASQLLIVQVAEQDLPEASDFASSVNISGFNIGIALGAWTGGCVVTSSLGLGYTPVAGAFFVAVALFCCLLYKHFSKMTG